MGIGDEVATMKIQDSCWKFDNLGPLDKSKDGSIYVKFLLHIDISTKARLSAWMKMDLSICFMPPTQSCSYYRTNLKAAKNWHERV